MARVFITIPTGGTFTVLYSVDQPVGSGSSNRRDDVLLVQFFLSRCRDVDARGNPGFNPPGENPIAIDGAFGRQTGAYIKFFQEENSRRSGLGRFVTDQRVDPLAGKLLGSKTSSLLAMAALNFEYFNRQGKGFHSNISIDPLFPPDLKPVLFI